MLPFLCAAISLALVVPALASSSLRLQALLVPPIPTWPDNAAALEHTGLALPEAPSRHPRAEALTWRAAQCECEFDLDLETERRRRRRKRVTVRVTAQLVVVVIGACPSSPFAWYGRGEHVVAVVVEVLLRY